MQSEIYGASARLGVPPAPILPGERGAPQWPAGYAGSITHCAGYRAAAVARTREMLTIGVDAEPHDVLPDGVLDHVSLPVLSNGMSMREARGPAWRAP